MRDHRRLRAFDLADQVALETYRLTKSFPKEEVYGLIAQMRRAAVSISSNIVEGCARESRAEYLRFLEISFGSARELAIRQAWQRGWDILVRRKVPHSLGNWTSAKRSWLH
jgi:four helix bundle protein